MLYTFGECELDTQLHVLSRAGQSVKLRPKAFELLVYLLEHRDRIVTKARAVCPGLAQPVHQ